MANRQNKLRIGVVLTAEARKALRSEPIQLFLKEGQYFNCDSISQDGFFLNMKLKLPEEGELVHEIAIQFRTCSTRFRRKPRLASALARRTRASSWGQIFSRLIHCLAPCLSSPSTFSYSLFTDSSPYFLSSRRTMKCPRAAD